MPKRSALSLAVTRSQEYRSRLIKKKQLNEESLSSAFFLMVYHNEFASMDAIMAYIAKHETNPGLAALADDTSLLRTFAVMEHVGADDRVQFWFVFWHDLWKSNGKMSKLKKKGALLNPKQQTSLCWCVLPLLPSHRSFPLPPLLPPSTSPFPPPLSMLPSALLQLSFHRTARLFKYADSRHTNYVGT